MYMKEDELFPEGSNKNIGSGILSPSISLSIACLYSPIWKNPPPTSGEKLALSLEDCKLESGGSNIPGVVAVFELAVTVAYSNPV